MASAPTSVTLDDVDSRIQYSTGWATYIKDQGGINATAWYGSDFHSCAANNPFYTAPACNATFSFTGREVTLVGDFNPSQQRFYVILDDALPWRWYNASALMPNIPVRTPALNYNRIQIRGLPYGLHKITFGQDRSDVMGNGITLDSVNYNTNTTEESPVWTSDFVPAEPNPAYLYSTQTAVNPLPSATSSSLTSASSSATSSAAPSATSQPSHSSSSTVALGAGLGAGLGVAAIIALTALVFFVKRRRSNGTSVDSGSYVSNGLDVHGAARSDWGGTQHVPSPSTYAPSAGIPEVQEQAHSPLSAQGNSPYYSSRSQKNLSVEGLDSPLTFTARGQL